MRKFIPLLLLLIAVATGYAQDCYNSTRSKGIRLYNQGKKTEAKRLFEAAQSCPDKPDDNDLASWIGKCKTDSGKSTTTRKINVERISLVDANNGLTSLTSSDYYTDQMAGLSVRLDVENSNKKSKNVTISLIVRDPDGEIMESLSSSHGYSETKEFTLVSGYNEVLFSSLGVYGNTFAPGAYVVEVYSEKKLLSNATFEIQVRPTYFTIEGNKYDYDRTICCVAGTATFDVQTNAKGIVIKHAPTWVKVEKDLVSNTSFTISFEENPTSEIRSGMMDVCTDDNAKQIVINLVQEGNPAFAHKFGDRMIKDAKMKLGASIAFGSFSAKSDGIISSVIDYGVSDVPSMASLEIPKYKAQGGFSVSFLADMPMNDYLFLETGATFLHFGIKNEFSNHKLLYANTYEMKYGCIERYNMNYLNIPVLLGYHLKLNSVYSLRFNTGFVFGLGIAAKCKLNNGYSDYETTDGEYYAKSSYTGSLNLFSGSYYIKQNYSTGSSPSFEFDGCKSNPFKRANIGWNFGTALDFGSFEIGLAYTFGLSNIGNMNYWENTDKVCGCLLRGEEIRTTKKIYGYKHHIGEFQISFNYWL